MDNVKSPAGVVVIIVWRSLFLLLLRDNKPEISFPNTWTPVTGGLNPGEDLIECGKRETEEEITFIPKRIYALGVSAKGNGFFFATLSDQEYAQVRLKEGQGFGWFTYDALSNINLGGAIRTYFGKFPEIFRRMAELEEVPAGEDLGLAVWKE